MFYASGEGLQPMAPSGPTDEFLEAIQVFHGDLTCCCRGHEGGAPCDREFLMLPMLGLYQQIYANRHEERMKKIHDVIEPIISDVFPATFEYTSDFTGTITKPLFGGLIEALRSKAQQDEVDKSCCQLCGLQSGKWFRPGTTCTTAEMPKRDLNFSFFETTFSNGVRKTVSLLPRRSDIHGGIGSAISRSCSSQSRSDTPLGTGALGYMGAATKIKSLRSSSSRSRVSNISYAADSAASSPRMAMEEGVIAGGERDSRSISPQRSPQCSSRSPQRPPLLLTSVEPTVSV
jgi:hypothetical protein